MYHDTTLTGATGATFWDFLEWAKETGENRDTICEIAKVAPRLDLTGDEWTRSRRISATSRR